jgi:polar amino acid transport system substrate-binding protein
MSGFTRRQVIATVSLATASLATAALLPIGAQAADDALVRVRKAGVLRVGTETQFAPFDFLENGTPKGLNYDLFDEIAKEMRVKVSWVALPWESVLPGLEAGKFDMVAGPATITKARMERYRFTSPIAEATVALMKRAGDTTINKPADIAGKAVGSGKATAQLAQLQKYAATLPAVPSIREYVDFSQAYADLAAGRIVAVANSFPNLADAVSKQKDKFALVTPPFGDKSYFGYIGRKDADSAPLLDAVDAALLRIKGDGRLAKLQEKWFGTTFTTPDRVTAPSF